MAPDRHFPGYVPNPHYTQEDWDEVCDNPEWTDEELAQAKPLAEVMPELAAAIEKQRAVEGEDRRDLVWLRIDRDVLAAFRDSGSRWQDRLNAILRDAVAHGALGNGSGEGAAGDAGDHSPGGA